MSPAPFPLWSYDPPRSVRCWPPATLEFRQFGPVAFAAKAGADEFLCTSEAASEDPADVAEAVREVLLLGLDAKPHRDERKWCKPKPGLPVFRLYTPRAVSAPPFLLVLEHGLQLKFATLSWDADEQEDEVVHLICSVLASRTAAPNPETEPAIRESGIGQKES